MNPERGPRTLPIERANRPYWLNNASLKAMVRNRTGGRKWAYGELQARKRYRDAHK